MNEKQILAILIGIFGVLLALLGWAAVYGSEWTEVAQGVAGATGVILIFAIVVAGIWAVVNRKG